MNEIYHEIFWWVLGIAGTIISSLIIAAALSVIKASKKVTVHDVKIDNILTNQAESQRRHELYQAEVLSANSKVISLFTSEIDPVKDDVKEIKEKQNHHSERIVRIETHLKID